MARVKDVFGFEELEKAFDKMSQKYPNQADALLMTAGRTANNRTKQLTPVKTRKLRNSWRLLKVKLYKGGKVRVVRVQSTAPHAHLVEDGHEIYKGHAGGRSNRQGRLTKLQGRLSVKSGRVEGKKMLETGLRETNSRFFGGAEKMLDELTREVEL